MNLRIIEAPTAEPVSLAEARLQCKIDAELSSPLTAHPDDDLVRTLITAARRYVEQHTRQVMTDATYEYRCASPSAGGCVMLPMGPIEEVASVKYLDEDEEERTLDPAVWYLNDDPWAPYVGLRKDQVWPALYRRPDAVRVQFSGAIASPNPVPAELVLAMKLMIAHWYANREDATPVELKEIPMGARMMMQLHRRGMGV